MREKKMEQENILYTPEHSWYSGSCLTLVTWRLSGSRQLHKAPEIWPKEWTWYYFHNYFI